MGQYSDLIKTENLFYKNSLFFNAKFPPNSLLALYLVQNGEFIIYNFYILMLLYNKFKVQRKDKEEN